MGFFGPQKEGIAGLQVFPHRLLEDGTFLMDGSTIFISPRDYEATCTDPRHILSLRWIGAPAVKKTAESSG